MCPQLTAICRSWQRRLLSLWWEVETADLTVLVDRNEVAICGCWSSHSLSPVFQRAEFYGSLCSQHKNKLDSQGKFGYCWRQYQEGFLLSPLWLHLSPALQREPGSSTECLRGPHASSKVTKRSQQSAEYCSVPKRKVGTHLQVPIQSK